MQEQNNLTGPVNHPIECNNIQNRMGLFLTALFIICLIALFAPWGNWIGTKLHFENKEGFHSDYQKELKLFREMTPVQQQEYLNLSKRQKLIKYGDRL